MRAVPRMPQRTCDMRSRLRSALSFASIRRLNSSDWPRGIDSVFQSAPVQVLGQQQDLVRVARIVRHLAADRLVDRVRLAANHRRCAADPRRSAASARRTRTASRAPIRPAAPRASDRRSSNSDRACRSGFSPSVVRKSIQRDRMLPAMWRIRTATLLASGSSVACSCSSDSCAIDLSASFLIFWNSSIDDRRESGESVGMFDDQRERHGHGGQPPRARRSPRGPRPATACSAACRMNPQRIPCVMEKVSGIRISVANAGTAISRRSNAMRVTVWNIETPTRISTADVA